MEESLRSFLDSLTDLEPEDRELLIRKCEEEKVFTMEDFLRTTRDDLREWGLATGPRNFVLAKLREKGATEFQFTIVPNNTLHNSQAAAPIDPAVYQRLDELMKRGREFCTDNRISIYHFGAKVLETKSRGAVSELFSGRAPKRNDTAIRYIRRMEQFFAVDELERKQLFQLEASPPKRRCFLTPTQRSTLDSLIKDKTNMNQKEKEHLVTIFRTIDPNKDISPVTITNYIKNQKSKQRKLQTQHQQQQQEQQQPQDEQQDPQQQQQQLLNASTSVIGSVHPASVGLPGIPSDIQSEITSELTAEIPAELTPPTA